jgi:hypothetical protein
MEVENAADYAGIFTAADGRTLVFAAEGKRLSLVDGAERIPLQRDSGEEFISTVAGSFAAYSLQFGRRDAGKEPAGHGRKHAGGPVVEVTYGPDWYAAASYDGPREFHPRAEDAAYAGHYRSDSPWGGDARVYMLKDRLMVEGAPLTPLGGGLFRLGEEAWSPLTAEFLHVFESKARLLRVTGMEYWRVEVD